MDIEIFREYIIFSKYLNISKAAKQLHLAPSSLSRHLSLLEKEVGACLYTRTKNPRLTPAGLHVLNKANSLWSEFENMVSQTASLNESFYADVKIAYLQEDREVVDRVCLAIAEISETFPHINIGQAGIKNISFFEALQTDDADIAILFNNEGINTTKYQLVPLFSDEIAVVLRKDSKFAGRTSVFPDELKDSTFFIPAAKQFEDFHGMGLEMIKRHGVKPNVHYISMNTMDEFYSFDAPDRVWFTSKSHFLGHKDSVPAPVFKNNIICDVESPYRVLQRYAAYKTDTSNAMVPLFLEILASSAGSEGYSLQRQGAR